MILITLGDPLSVNIEILGQLLNSEFFYEKNKKNTTVIIGSYPEWVYQLDYLGIPSKSIELISSLDIKLSFGLYFYNIANSDKIPEKRDISYRAKIACSSLSISKKFLQIYKNTVLLSCPLDKKLLFEGFQIKCGQTEYYETFADKKALMLMRSQKITVGLVTNHLALKDVPISLSASLILEKLEIFYQFYKKQLNIKYPKIAVCALNPHCGDQGLFGSEDKEIILPAIRAFNLKNKADIVFGPFPADTVFWYAAEGRYDGVLAMYHDQGLGPIKTLSFFETINISAGLPFLRVSPAHGPASDVFLQNKGNVLSFKEAFKFAFLSHNESNQLDV